MVKGSVVLLDDTFPHGTVAGFDRGCKGGACPAAIPCRDVKRRYGSDMDFRRLIDAGVSLEEIISIDQAAAERDALFERNRQRAQKGLAPLTLEDADAAQARRPKRARPSAKEPVGEGVTTVITSGGFVDLRRQWAVRKVWVAIAPDGSLHGPFDEHEQGVVFVSAQFPSEVAPEPQEASARRPRRPWTAADTQRVKELWKAQFSNSRIAQQMDRDQGTVGRHLRRLGLAPNGSFTGTGPA